MATFNLGDSSMSSQDRDFLNNINNLPYIPAKEIKTDADAANASLLEKLQYVIKDALNKAPSDIKSKLEKLNTPQNYTSLAANMAAQTNPVSAAISDVIGVYFAAIEGAEVAKEFAKFIQKTYTAKSITDLKSAGDSLSKASSGALVDTIVGFALHKANGSIHNNRPPGGGLLPQRIQNRSELPNTQNEVIAATTAADPSTQTIATVATTLPDTAASTPNTDRRSSNPTVSLGATFNEPIKVPATFNLPIDRSNSTALTGGTDTSPTASIGGTSNTALTGGSTALTGGQSNDSQALQQTA